MLIIIIVVVVPIRVIDHFLPTENAKTSIILLHKPERIHRKWSLFSLVDIDDGIMESDDDTQ